VSTFSTFGQLRAFSIPDREINLFNFEHFAFENHDGWVEFRPPLDKSRPSKVQSELANTARGKTSLCSTGACTWEA
jgi:hypothetical protein